MPKCRAKCNTSKKTQCCREQTGFVNSNGVNLFFRQRSPHNLDPSKPPLLFIHGFAFSSEIWQCQQIYFCCLGYRTVAFDLPGHGFSEKTTNPAAYTTQAIRDDITNVLNHFGFVKPIIIGHSLGGLYTLDYALQNQANLTAVVTVGAFANLGQATFETTNALIQFLLNTPNLQQFAIAFDTPGVLETHLSNCPGADVLLQTLIQITQQASLDSLQVAFKNFIKNPVNLMPQLVNLTLPVFVVQGTIDGTIFPATGDQIRDAINTGKCGTGLNNIANAALFEIRNRGHLPFATEFKLFNRAVKEFIQSETCNVCPFIRAS